MSLVANQMITYPDRQPFEKIHELAPAFNNGYGWIEVTELNLIDPNGDRFDTVDEIIFIDGSMFVNVVPTTNKQ
jgi:hypothetical protein